MISAIVLQEYEDNCKIGDPLDMNCILRRTGEKTTDHRKE